MLSLILKRRFSYNPVKYQITKKSREIMNSNKKIIAVCQMNSSNNKTKNFSICEKLIADSVKYGAQMVFLPEGFDYIANSKEDSVSMSELVTGDLMTRYKDLASRYKVWLSLGGFHEKLEENYISNSHIVINSDGKLVANYKKVHLFDVNLPSQGVTLRESSYVKPGSTLVPPVETPIGKLGIAICYDVRFPEVGLWLKGTGAELLAYPSAFSFPTGAHHWQTLLAARAIENQCYVVAAAQTGPHGPTRRSWGHAMIVDPYGTVVAQCSEGDSIAVAEIDLNYIRRLGEQMPLAQHRRYDVYPAFNIMSTEEKLKEFVSEESESCLIKNGRYCYILLATGDASRIIISTKMKKSGIAELSQEAITELQQLSGAVHVALLKLHPGHRVMTSLGEGHKLEPHEEHDICITVKVEDPASGSEVPISKNIAELLHQSSC